MESATQVPSASDGSRLIASGTQTTSMHNWKIVKNFSTRLTVLRCFGVKCRIEKTWVEIQLENSTPSESAATKIRGVVGKAVDACKNLALNHAAFGPILLTLIGSQALKHPGVISFTTTAVAVVATVWVITQLAAKKQVLLFCTFSLTLISGVSADDPTENHKPKDPNAWETHGDYAKALAATVLALVLTSGGAGVARRMYNRWRPLLVAQVAPVPAFDVMRGLAQSPVPTRGNPIFDIPPEL